MGQTDQIILLDTQAAIWLALDPSRLSSRARRTILSAEPDALAISALTIYEIAWIVQRGRIVLAEPIGSFLEAIQAQFHVQPVTHQIAFAAAQLPSTFPSDPFDRIIAATAMTSGAVLITADERIRRSGAVRTVW